MLPAPSRSSQAFWRGGEHGELRIHRCGACGRWFMPPAPACFRCRSRDVAAEAASGRARVAAFTVTEHQWFPGFPPPYVIAIVELEEQADVRLTTNVIGCSPAAVATGMPVEVVFEAWDDVWIPLFRPRGGAGTP